MRLFVCAYTQAIINAYAMATDIACACKGLEDGTMTVPVIHDYFMTIPVNSRQWVLLLLHDPHQELLW